MRFFDVRVGRDGGERTVRVASPTAVQASDAAVDLMKPGEAIVSINEAVDDGLHHTDGGPPPTQAEALASTTPGAAALVRGDPRRLG